MKIKSLFKISIIVMTVTTLFLLPYVSNWDSIYEIIVENSDNPVFQKYAATPEEDLFNLFKYLMIYSIFYITVNIIIYMGYVHGKILKNLVIFNMLISTISVFVGLGLFIGPIFSIIGSYKILKYENNNLESPGA